MYKKTLNKKGNRTYLRRCGWLEATLPIASTLSRYRALKSRPIDMTPKRRSLRATEGTY